MDKKTISEVMREMGRRGGKKAAGKGGRLLADRMTPEERSERASKAARARWKKAKAIGDRGKAKKKGR